MANKREFKKYVSSVSSSICNYMMEIGIMTPEADHNTIEDAMIKVLTAAEDAVIKSNIRFDKSEGAFPEGGYGKARTAFYKALFTKTNKEFRAAIDAALKTYNEAIPAEVKARNKANL